MPDLRRHRQDRVIRGQRGQPLGVVRDAQAQGRTPAVVLTGGTIANLAFERLDPQAADWAGVDWYWGDERYVSADSDERNEKQAIYAPQLLPDIALLDAGLTIGMPPRGYQ